MQILKAVLSSCSLISVLIVCVCVFFPNLFHFKYLTYSFSLLYFLYIFHLSLALILSFKVMLRSAYFFDAGLSLLCNISTIFNDRFHF